MEKLNLCNRCNEQLAVRQFDDEALCDSCTIYRLSRAVERLQSGYITATIDIVYEKDD
jgi:hypothetical protein